MMRLAVDFYTCGPAVVAGDFSMSSYIGVGPAHLGVGSFHRSGTDADSQISINSMKAMC